MSVGGSVDDAAAIAAGALLGCTVSGLKQVGGGRNSRVFRVDGERGVFALKQYPSREDDPRDRLGTEAAALQWMEAQGLAMTPRFVACDRSRNFALLSWVDGRLVETVTSSDIDLAVAFLGRLHELRGTVPEATFELASEACLSGAEIERQVCARSASLRGLRNESALQHFLTREFDPACDRLFVAARDGLAQSGQSYTSALPQDRRSLVPADFGFHNALRGSDGRLTFIDFEYFGWDDPVKLTADILLHPGRALATPLKQRFRAAALRLYGDDPGFAARLSAFYPLFGLRWALILLNEFHPERWRRRVLAGEREEWAEVKARQLELARSMLSRMTGKGEGE